IQAIIAANNLNAEGLIFVDQVLIIPVAEAPIPTATPTYSPTSLGIIPTNTPVGAGPTPIPPTAVPTTAPTTPGTTTYTVIAGDTLNRIAARFGTTVDAIVQRNGILNPNLIIIGQVLTLPVTVQQPPAPPTPAPQPQQPDLHVVQPGENLFRISLRYGIPVNTLAQLNGIYNVNRIFVGQVIRLR
ncbi:MAG: LysM peptidoglycan-binding domain-containing protein, partial [Anaerolineae bacterium]|nr:LysM peptidoglycan-binding domain-containing protein [Anaerolineae bacterium]